MNSEALRGPTATSPPVSGDRTDRRAVGHVVIDARGLSWRARRDAAWFKGEKFDEAPPYDMRPFGYSNET